MTPQTSLLTKPEADAASDTAAEATVTTEVAAHTAPTDAFAADLLQVQALLTARAYLYALFHKMLGGTPDAALVTALTSAVTRDVLDEYREASPAVAALLTKLETLAHATTDEQASFTNQAADEYTRVFVGPMALPSSPYESPYKGAHDIALFQQNTLEVRACYREAGLQPKRMQAIPDDHVSLLCNFMAKRAKAALNLFEADNFAALAEELTSQRTFVNIHLDGWLGAFADNVDSSAAGRDHVLYAAALHALDGFTDADLNFLTEAAYWCEQEATAAVEAGPVIRANKDAFTEVTAALSEVEALEPFGIGDFALVPVEEA